MKANIVVILRILMVIAGILLFGLFFFPGLFTNHFHIGVVTGVILSVILALYGLFFDRINHFLVFFWSKILGKIVLGALAAACLAIFVLAVMCMVSMGKGSSKAPEPGSTVVVLGCRVYPSGPSRMLASRLNAAYSYLEENPESECIVCGGQGSNEPEPEAEVMARYLIGKGIDPSRIYIENTSQDTLENLKNADAIIRENGLNPVCAVTTNEFHCYRALKYAETLGYESPGMVSAPTLWWMFPSNYIREMYGILEMWFLN